MSAGFAAQFANLTLREARDEDAAGMIELVGSCYAEHAGMVLELEGEDADLPAPATTFARRHGRLWVVTDPAGVVVASVGIKPAHDEQGAIPGAGAFELKRLYVLARARRMGLAAALMDHAEHEARAAGARRMVLWSDTRLTDAHRFYEKRGYERGPRTRELHDLSNSIEYFYARSL